MAKNELAASQKNADLNSQIVENLVNAKQQFLLNISHEIPTPMTSITGYTNVILKTKLTDTQNKYINVIEVSGESMIMLINDNLDLAWVDSGKRPFEYVPFYLFSSV